MTAIEAQYLESLKQVKTECEGDPEAWHSAAEAVMLEFLRAAGFSTFATEYNNQSQHWWYA